MTQLTVPAARIDWLPDGTPRSLDFDDIYFSRDGGLAESTYVYLHGNRLPDRWPEHFRQQPAFSLFEAGFGTGLNFLLTLRAFLAAAPTLPAHARLHYLSVEMQPLSAADLRKALSCFPELAPLGDALLQQYPPHFRGWHRLTFADQRITLTLIFDTVDTALQQLQTTSTKIDAWYLDGFAPAKNDSMWAETVITSVAQLSRAGATASSFTAAGFVRRALQANGFSARRAPGFGRKREMICAVKAGLDSAEMLPAWAPTRVRVIGAGIAGLVTARAFAERGCQVDVFEKSAQTGGALSGHPAALASPKLTREHSLHSQLQLAGFFLLDRFLARSGSAGAHPVGALEHSNAEDYARYHAGGWPTDQLSVTDAKQFVQLSHFSSSDCWLRRSHARLVDVPALLAELTAHPNLHLHLNQSCAPTENPEHLTVICSGADAPDHYRHLPIQAVRGQASFLPMFAASAGLQTPLRFGGYLLPARQGWHVLGSTYDRQDPERALRASDQQRNLEKLAAVAPDWAAHWRDAPLAGVVGWRVSTRDRLPIAGFISPHTAVHVGHGSHGLCTAWVGAELLAAQVFNEPSPVIPDWQQRLSPQRF